MDQRFAADKEQVADVVFDADVDHVPRLFQGDAAALARVESVHGESAKIALGVADIGDGKLQIAGAAMRQDFAGEPPESFASVWGPGHGTVLERPALFQPRYFLEQCRCRSPL